MIERLQIKELQELVGNETLDRLKAIVPYIPNSGIEHPNDIYEKNSLVKIFLSFAGQDCFFQKEFRLKLVSRLSETEINILAKNLKIDTKSLSFEQLIKKIADVEWGHNEETKKFMEYFKLPYHYLPSPKQTLQNIETIKKPDTPFKILKDFQIRVFEEAMSKLENPMERFIIQMPTGSGKTRTAMEIIALYLNKNPGKSIIWISHSDELCEQAVESFKDVWTHVGAFDADIIRVWANNDLKVPNRSSFIVAGFSKLNSAFKKNKELSALISKNLVMIVVDEAHQIIAPTYKKVINSLLDSNYVAHLIGLTATPGRSNIEIAETRELIKFFFRNKIQIDSGDKTVFKFLRDKQVLAYVEKDPLLTGRVYELSKDERRYLETYFDFPPGLLERISQDDVRNIEIIKKLKTECESNKKIIFFGGSVEHSKFICATLNFMGFRAEHIDGDTRKDRRRNIIKEFKDGNLNTICNFGVLTTGFDAPKTDVIFIARPTMSVVLYSQMVGRGLRGPAIGGKKKCKLIDVIDNIEAYTSPENVYDYFEEYWELNE